MKPIITALVFLLPAFSAVEAQQEAVPSSGCMEALAGGFGSFAYFPGNSNLTVWDEKQQEDQSACRVQPTTTEDVSNILHILLDASCRFAVKGGGHARGPDDSVSVGGVTIDMQKMRSIDVSADRLSVKLGSGHVLHSMYVGLENYNLTTLGGRVADVGLGGFALGGGFSALSPMYGLAMDNIFEYELVLPNATVRTINDQTHPDLYFALRGGMNNFGIVTHFTIRAVPQGQMHGGSRIYSVDKREDILEQAYQLTTTWKNDTAMAFYYRFEYDQEADDFILGMNQEYAHPISNPPPFRQVNEVPFESSTLRIDWPSNFSVEGISPSGGRNLYATVTYYPSADLDRKMQDILMEEIQPIKEIPGFTPSLVIQPLYEAAIRANSERGGSAAGIEADGPLTGTLVPTVY
ncbi:hypothetical protein N7505_005788 [Penicillium chrysogenum]|uniref:FAD-binding PCMH-type domain-containing protein n=1 Tax=Penicillium chrysogenum TaxID=5076 RepID=A0ABQ8WK80_PENCH|nr:hypothetical protein N7505_005788 [Penicillium chrysogenum]